MLSHFSYKKGDYIIGVCGEDGMKRGDLITMDDLHVTTFYKPPQKEVVMKVGDRVKVRDSSWSFEFINGKRTQIRGGDRSVKDGVWRIVDRDIKYSCVCYYFGGEKTNIVNDTVIYDAEQDRTIFAQMRFLEPYDDLEEAKEKKESSRKKWAEIRDDARIIK
jgi:hypothetical protein